MSICVEVDATRIERRLATRYLDKATASLSEALGDGAGERRRTGAALSIGLLGNAAEILPQMVAMGFVPDLVTDQTSAHDPMWGYLPPSTADEDVNVLRSAKPEEYAARVRESIAGHVRAILAMQRAGAIAFDYGNNLRTQAKLAGVTDAMEYPGFVPAFIRDSFCEGRGPFRWVALSGDPADIAKTDAALLWSCFRRTSGCRSGCGLRRRRLRFRGCRQGSAGWDIASATRRGCCSTRWCARGSWRRRS